MDLFHLFLQGYLKGLILNNVNKISFKQKNKNLPGGPGGPGGPSIIPVGISSPAFNVVVIPRSPLSPLSPYNDNKKKQNKLSWDEQINTNAI